MRKLLATIAGLVCCLLLTAASLAHGPAALSKKATQLSPERCEDVETVDQCHMNYPTGCGIPKNATNANYTPRYDAYLNYLKNQTPKSTIQPVKILTRADFTGLEDKMPADLKKGHNGEHAAELAALGQGQILGLVGYLYIVQVTGKESTNCELSGADDQGRDKTDYHIHVGFDETAARRLRDGWKPTKDETLGLQQTSVIVEMTPHYRQWHQPTWTAERLQPHLGRQVRVIGQLLADNEHADASANCAHPNADKNKCWRASIWELHPVIEFYICSEVTCAPNSPNWKKVKDLP